MTTDCLAAAYVYTRMDGARVYHVNGHDVTTYPDGRVDLGAATGLGLAAVRDAIRACHAPVHPLTRETLGAAPASAA